ncbi:MetQ/NlpA family ABC transporter substrate-binding protein [Nodosilinea sp. FACHB-131]|uniref:MetQ/NlpA family ABC transporter substrate-binding protein n=1 Tax=Cyanophyceae TaxID=3028117 RepID=UPI00168475BC|nr:MetQ/NlpA family ABC transporter substrate-binding protein [Nodosilinea sp. FACHB-131]MBD1872423.1 MetQ/NlpA family ABC transporter substrate-binding protein [Nodosilinea sp. FACHB-131]
MNRRFFLLTAGSFAATTMVAGCGATRSGGSNAGGNTLRVGVSPVPHGEILAYVRDNLAASEGLTIEVVEFSDYVLPNTALNDGQLEANYFQHVPYMEDFAKQRGLDLVFVKGVHLEPLGLYSKKVTVLSEVPEGAQVSVPNDATNLGRALKLLEDNGLLTLKGGAGVNATKQDVETNPKNLSLVELEAAQLPRALDDVDIGVVNGNYALEVGLNPAEDALALEKSDGNPYANGLVVLSGQENDSNIQKLAQLLNSDQVRAFINDKYQGAVIPVF